MTRHLLTVIVAAIVAVSALAPACPTIASAEAAARGDKTVTPEDDGKIVTLAQGRRLTIAIEESPTGYRWLYKTKPNKKILKLVSDKTGPDPNPPGTAGGSVPRRIIYRARKPGTTKIKLQHVRFDGDVDDSLAVTVKVPPRHLG